MSYQRLADFLLLISGLYVCLRMGMIFWKAVSWHIRILAVSGFTLFLTLLLYYVSGYIGVSHSLEMMIGWGRIITITILLIGLMEYTHYSKPEYARFPRMFIFLPLLLLVFWPFIDRTLVLKEWLMGIYEGGGLVAAILLVAINRHKGEQNYLTLVGLCLFAVSYLTYWFSSDIFQGNGWIWEISFCIALIVSVHGWIGYHNEMLAAGLDVRPVE